MRATAVFADLETGGVKPAHPDIQIAAIAIRDWHEVGTFEAKIEFDVSKCDPEALRINHYDPSVWKEHAIPESAAVKAFDVFLRTHSSLTKFSKAGKPYSIARIAGHNIKTFDAPRLAAMFKRHGQFLHADSYRPLDTMQLALWYFVGRPDEPEDYKLGTVAKALGVPTTDQHDALSDARMAARVAWAIHSRQGG